MPPVKIEAAITRIVDDFLGDFGAIRVRHIREGFGFGFLKPETPLRMTTWSFFEDRGFACFVEGVFYDDYGSQRITKGEDPELARALVMAFHKEGEKALARLNGSFAGFIFDFRSGALGTFLDRLGTRPIYWTESNGAVVCSTNLASLQSVREPVLEPTSAFQFLTLGFPIGERTLLREVFVQLPGTIRTFESASRKVSRYWNPPAREAEMSLGEAVSQIVGSMEQCVSRIARRTTGGIGLGMTGGHDSRVIFSSLLHENIPFETVSWRDHNFNDRVVANLCGLAGKSPHFVSPASPQQLLDIQERAFVYADGQHLHAYGFSLIGMECARLGLESLLLGFNGDVWSGSASIPHPLYIKRISKVVWSALREQKGPLRFSDAEALLADCGRRVVDETIEEWRESFAKEEWRGSSPDIYIWQFLQNRNIKRLLPVMNAVRQSVDVMYPYLESDVMDVYLRLPVKFLNQRPHCYAGFYRFPEFGSYQAGGFPVSLRQEATFPLGLYLLRLVSTNVQAIRTKFGRGDDPSTWSAADTAVFREVSESAVFNPDRLRQFADGHRLKVKGLRKMQTLARFHGSFVAGAVAEAGARKT